ncbi:MAG: GatB/YqeY domain-containing protein [Ottowia sp.]|nr:GatB/YqeY domain-containing protein [Ottowia sp.]
MSLKQNIIQDMQAAMRAKDSERLGTIRMLLAAIKQKEVDERIELDDAMVIAIVDKLIKQRRDSITQFKQAGRDDLVARETSEEALLLTYMPEPLSAQEIEDAIAQAMIQSGAQGLKEMGAVMSLLKEKLAGRADMSSVSAMLRTRLMAL